MTAVEKTPSHCRFFIQVRDGNSISTTEKPLASVQGLRDLLQDLPSGSVWWLDIQNPTEDDVGLIAHLLSIYPLTAEDIIVQELREKVDAFKNYYFVRFLSFELDGDHGQSPQPLDFCTVVFQHGIVTFSSIGSGHVDRVRARMRNLSDAHTLNSDWLCYAMIDEIVDRFVPVIQSIEYDVDSIEDLVFVARLEDAQDVVLRIGELRKKVMDLERLLGGKADVVKKLVKRCGLQQPGASPNNEIGLHLGDVQDHIVTMMSSLTYCEEIITRTHSNCLAQQSVNNLRTGNTVSLVLSRITVLAAIAVSLQFVTGLFGMNVPVPGQESGSRGPFWGVLGFLSLFVIVSFCVVRRYKLV